MPFPDLIPMKNVNPTSALSVCATAKLHHQMTTATVAHLCGRTLPSCLVERKSSRFIGSIPTSATALAPTTVDEVDFYSQLRPNTVTPTHSKSRAVHSLPLPACSGGNPLVDQQVSKSCELLAFVSTMTDGGEVPCRPVVRLGDIPRQPLNMLHGNEFVRTVVSNLLVDEENECCDC